MYKYVIRKYELKKYVIDIGIYNYLNNLPVHVPNNPVRKYVQNIIVQYKYQLLFPYYNNGRYYNFTICSLCINGKTYGIN